MPLYAYCFLLEVNQLDVCNLMHDAFLDSLDWISGPATSMNFYFPGFLFTLHCTNTYLGSTGSDVCIYPAFVSLFTYTIYPIGSQSWSFVSFPLLLDA